VRGDGSFDAGSGRLAAEAVGGIHPGIRVPALLLRAEMGADRDQLGEGRHRFHLAELGDPDETVCIEVVAEQECGFGIRRVEQP
jgi:hypothetical protein